MGEEKTMISLILPIGSDASPELIERVKGLHTKHSVEVELIIATPPGLFILSQARNIGAKQASCDWLVFSDADTYYRTHLFEEMLALDEPAVAGRSRANVNDVGGSPGEYWRVGFAPLLIKKELFESLGGYCEQYKGWGYEDSDFEQKLPRLVDYDSKALHVLPLHEALTTVEWGWGKDKNRPLFDSRMKLSVEQRIADDKAVYG